MTLTYLPSLVIRKNSLPVVSVEAPRQYGTWIPFFVFIIILSYLLVTRFTTWRRLSSFPGPLCASISYLPMLRIRRTRHPHLTYASLSKRYGPLTRIGPNDLLASDPDLLRRMSAARSTYERSSWYKATRLDPYHDMMGSVMDKGTHASLRAKVAAGYTGKDNPNLDEDLDSQIQALVRLIEREYLTDPSSKTKPVNFGQLADFYAHDSRSKLAFGKPLGMLEQNRDVHGIVGIVKFALEWIQVFTDIPPLQKVFLSSTALKLLGPKPRHEFGVGKLMGMARELVASRFAPGAKDQQDLLGSFLRHGLDRRSAESEVMFSIIAGADTTASALKRTVLHVASHPRAGAALRREIRDAAAAGRLSAPATHDEAAGLPYLRAAVWESLRAHPPFGGLVMKQAGAGGDRAGGGALIPPGTRVAHSTWAVTHDARVFGPDVDAYRPERWLEAGEEAYGAMQRQTELVFGSGRFGCPGRAVALRELSKVLVELFRNFDFEPLLQETTSEEEKTNSWQDGSLPLVIRKSEE